MAGNIDVELNLVVGENKHVLPNFILPTFNTSIKNSKCLHFNKQLLKKLKNLKRK